VVAPPDVPAMPGIEQAWILHRRAYRMKAMTTQIHPVSTQSAAQAEPHLSSASSLRSSGQTFPITSDLLKKLTDAAGFCARFNSESVLSASLVLTDDNVSVSLEISKNAKPTEVALRYSREAWLTEETVSTKLSQATEYVANSHLSDLRSIVTEFLQKRQEREAEPYKICIDLKQLSLTTFVVQDQIGSEISADFAAPDCQSGSNSQERKQTMPAETIVSDEVVYTERAERTDAAKYATYSKSEVDRMLKAQAEAITSSLGGKIAVQSKMFQEAIAEQQKVFAKSIERVVQHADEFRARLETSVSSQGNTTSDQLDRFNTELSKELDLFKSSITKSIVPNIKTLDEKLKALQPTSEDPAKSHAPTAPNNNVFVALLIANILATIATAALVLMRH
jgi:hypothetical protein